ncbi:MAG: class I SAM-dependent methyltransferase [Paenibacillaceae bacterium]
MSLRHDSERVIENFSNNSLEDYLIYQFHVATYRFAQRLTSGKKVLDFGCGSGYGTAYIADYCNEIVGVDISLDAISYANSNYNASNLSFKCIEPVEEKSLPFLDLEFDMVISFQVIEHIKDTKSYLGEIRRVLKPNGVVIIVTPDRSTRLFGFQKPWNKWHVSEYSKTSLMVLINSYFEKVEMLQMGAPDSVLKSELERTKMMKWLTLPITLPFIPEIIRLRGLELLKSIKSIKRKSTKSNAVHYTFDDSAFFVEENVPKSINLIAVGYKK